MTKGYTVHYKPGRHHQIGARDMAILEEAIANIPETDRIMAEAHARIGARIDRAMAAAQQRKEAHEEAQT